MELALRLLPIIGLTFALDCGNVAKVDWPWSTGQNGRIEFTAPQSANGWSIVMIFDKNLASNGLSVWNGNGVSCFGVLCTFTNVSYNSVINRGNQLKCHARMTNHVSNISFRKFCKSRLSNPFFKSSCTCCHQHYVQWDRAM